MDGDGDMDVLAASESKNSVYLFRNNGKEGNDLEIIDNGTAMGVGYAQAADLDGDGDMDIAAAASPLAWYRNEGGGKFNKIVFSQGSADDLIDLDGDGDQDVLHGKTWVKNDGQESPYLRTWDGAVSQSMPRTWTVTVI